MVDTTDSGLPPGIDLSVPRDRHLFGPGPKRILALDGGGVRGVLTIAFLERIEEILKQQTGKPMRLADHFDLIGGTSTGSIIAVALAQSDFQNKEWATYIDDSWRIHPRLTLSLGFRWEVMQPLLDKLGLEPNVQLNQPLPNVANVQDQSKHPVYVRTGTGNFYDGLAFRYSPYYTTPGAATPVGGLPALQTVRDGRLGDRLINSSALAAAPFPANARLVTNPRRSPAAWSKR